MLSDNEHRVRLDHVARPATVFISHLQTVRFKQHGGLGFGLESIESPDHCRSLFPRQSVHDGMLSGATKQDRMVAVDPIIVRFYDDRQHGGDIRGVPISPLPVKRFPAADHQQSGSGGDVVNQLPLRQFIEAYGGVIGQNDQPASLNVLSIDRFMRREIIEVPTPRCHQPGKIRGSTGQ